MKQKSISNSEEKQRLKNTIDSLSQSDLLQDLKFPEIVAGEWLYLSVKRRKSGLLKNQVEIMDTIKTIAADPEIIDLTPQSLNANQNLIKSEKPE